MFVKQKELIDEDFVIDLVSQANNKPALSKSVAKYNGGFLPVDLAFIDKKIALKNFKMKKTLLLIITFLLFSCKGQEKSSDWKTLEKLSSKDKTKYILSLKDEFPYFNDLVSNTKSYLDKFTFIDLDNDGDNDLIYIGESGAEPKCIRIFLNNKNTFNKVFDEFSNKPKLTFEGKKLINLKVFQSHCCGESWDLHVKYFLFEISTNNLKNNKIEDYYVFEANEEPLNYLKPYKVKTTIAVNARYSPAIGIIPKKEYKEELKMSENIIGNLKTNVFLNVIGEKKDNKDGRTWLYVEAKKSQFENENFVIFGDEDQFSIRCWISKKNVESEITNSFSEKWHGKYILTLNEESEDWRDIHDFELVISKDGATYLAKGFQLYEFYKLTIQQSNNKTLQFKFLKALDNTMSEVSLQKTKDFGQLQFDGKKFTWICPYINKKFEDGKTTKYVLKKK